jgi:hypothetical protein
MWFGYSREPDAVDHPVEVGWVAMWFGYTHDLPNREVDSVSSWGSYVVRIHIVGAPARPVAVIGYADVGLHSESTV